MKGPSKTSAAQDFFQDVADFLEKTLSDEVLSRSALEQRARLQEKLATLIRASHNSTMELYIDMSTNPVTADSFFSITSISNEMYEEPLDTTSTSTFTSPDSQRCSTPIESTESSPKTSVTATPSSSVVYEDALSVTSDSSIMTNSDFTAIFSEKIISASEAEVHKIYSGHLKRRNSRKLLTAWRQCWAVLVAQQLFLYSSRNDRKPKTVLDLAAGFQVKLGLRQKMDVKLLKMQTFSIVIGDKPVYEFAAKTREELDNWISALQSLLIKKDQSPPPEDFYDEPFDGEIYDVINDVVKPVEDVYDEVNVNDPGTLPSIQEKDCGQEEIYESLHIEEKAPDTSLGDTYDILPALIRPVDSPSDQTETCEEHVRQIDVQGPEVYDIPQCNRPVSSGTGEEVQSYDIVTTPPKLVANNRTPNNIKKLTQFWQGKMETGTVSITTKSVGRSFSRPAASRPQIENMMRNSLVADTIEKLTVSQSAESSPTKKEPPPRPPGPYRVSPMEPIRSDGRVQYKARWAYVAQNKDEISINHGEVLDVVTKNGSFWLVQSRLRKGLVPREYLVPLSTP